MIHIEHYHACEQAPILAALAELKDIIMAIQDTVATLKTEVAETKAQGAVVLTALNGLLGVVQPLIDANVTAQAALAAAQAALAASAADTAAIEAELAAASTELDATQKSVQPAVDAALAALPPAPPVP